MMNRLRLYSSFTLDAYQSRTGLSSDTILPHLQQAKQKQLMSENTDGSWQVSHLGHRDLNDVLEMVL
jgi:coproporphyrinogen III oxidase-like Fe-S oxidoreductase